MNSRFGDEMSNLKITIKLRPIVSYWSIWCAKAGKLFFTSVVQQIYGVQQIQSSSQSILFGIESK